MDAINWTQLAVVLTGLTLTVAGLQVNRWMYLRRAGLRRVSGALRVYQEATRNV